jgi:hypothetical protein
VVKPAIAICMVFAGVASTAGAQDRVALLLAGDRTEVLARQLAVQLASRGGEVVVAAPPIAETAIARAAAAQTAAVQLGATAAVWIDENEFGGALLRAVASGGDDVAYSPLPTTLASIDPTLFAAVAESLLDDLGRAPLGPPPVVRVASLAPVPPPPWDPEHARWGTPEEEPPPDGLPDTLFALRASGVFAGIGAGAMLDASVYVSEHARIAVFGSVILKFEDANRSAAIGGTISYVTALDDVRFTLGVEAFAILDTITLVHPIACVMSSCVVPPPQHEQELGFGLGGLAGVAFEAGPVVIGLDAHLFGVSIDDDGFYLLPGLAPFLEIPI